MKRERTFKPMLLILLLFCLSGCFSEIDSGPNVYYDDYGRVWSAAVNALDESGYVIVQMRRSEGYISTDRLERGGLRSKLSLRFYNTEDGGILVKISGVCEYYGERLGSNPVIMEWRSTSCSGMYRSRVERSMNKKLPGKFKIKE